MLLRKLYGSVQPDCLQSRAVATPESAMPLRGLPHFGYRRGAGIRMGCAQSDEWAV
jgi:hypothetical protein